MKKWLFLLLELNAAGGVFVLPKKSRVML